MTNDTAELLADAVAQALTEDAAYQLARYFTTDAALDAAWMRVREVVARVMDDTRNRVYAEVFAAKAEGRAWDLDKAVNG